MSEYIPDRSYDRRRNVNLPDSIPEQHRNVAQGARTMASMLRARAEEAAAQGDLLTHQTATRQAERHEQLAGYHDAQADQREDKIAGHPSMWQAPDYGQLSGQPGDLVAHEKSDSDEARSEWATQVDEARLQGRL